MKLTDSAAKLFKVLVDQISTGRFDPNKPETFLGYGEALDLVQLSPNTTRGATDGQTLQFNGMEALALWLVNQSPSLPAITGLIVSKSSVDIHRERRTPNIPGKKFFTVFKRKDEDYVWWLDQARLAIEFDWSPYLQVSVNEPVQAPRLDLLELTLIQKAGYAHGWEIVKESSSERVIMFSSRHKAEAHVAPSQKNNIWQVTFPKGPPLVELTHMLPELHTNDDAFKVEDEESLGRLLRRAAEVSMSLPHQIGEAFAKELADIKSYLPSSTEVLALVKQRRGQDLFRKALMQYWGRACAVTGIAAPELLRASHAKPWSQCASDQERINVYNGFLLCAHLDALFDSGMMTFSTEGSAVCSDKLNDGARKILRLNNLRLRMISEHHQTFLEWHREHIFLK